MDQTYIQKLQNITLTDEGETETRYGRIINKSEPGVQAYHQKQRSMGAIESFAAEASKPTAQVPSADYKLYERNNIIASSKYATPKQVETIIPNKLSEENDVYVQCAKPQASVSPTPIYGGSAQYTGSPHSNVGNYSSPVYENINYYGTKMGNQSYYHQQIGRNSPSNYSDTSFYKAQPQVPSGNKLFTGSDSEALPVYENVLELSHKSSGAVPGPQVAAGQPQAPPPYPIPHQNYSSQPIYSIMHSPKAASTLPKSSLQKFRPEVMSSRSLTQQQLDEINASDYVCMTGSISQQFQTTSAKNYERTPATGIAGTPTSPRKEVKKLPERTEARTQLPPSPTPSSTSTTSSTKLKFTGKNLLPYSVTPPRPRGPTEAQKKIEEMTRQIEEEMEKHEEEGEYFGR